MTNIVVISEFWPTRANATGGIFVSQQIAALCRAGCRVTLLVARVLGKRQRNLRPEELGLPAEVALVEMPLVRAPRDILSAASAYRMNVGIVGFSVSRALRALTAGAPPDGCIAHGLRYYGASASRWSRHIRSRKIVIAHGVDQYVMRQPITDLARSYLRRSSALVDAVGLVGSPLRAYADLLGIDAAKTIVIPNGTDLPPLADLPPESAGKDGSLRFVSVARLIPQKGIDDSLRALALLTTRYDFSSWEYRVVGRGRERERLEALAGSLGLGDRVRFLGQPSYEETMREVAGADVFCLPSWEEAFGIVYLEAMARRKATIGCHGNGAADIIADGVDGILVPPRSPEALAGAFKRLAEAPELRRRLGRKARDTAERFSWDANARRLLGVLGGQERLALPRQP